MYKVSFAVLLLAVVCTAIPLHPEEENINVQGQYEPAPHGARQARATCDLLSFSIKGVTLNHAACAAHCLVNGRGNRGGSCVNGVCICRK